MLVEITDYIAGHAHPSYDMRSILLVFIFFYDTSQIIIFFGKNWIVKFINKVLFKILKGLYV